MQTFDFLDLLPVVEKNYVRVPDLNIFHQKHNM
jgi:hypothetical protein